MEIIETEQSYSASSLPLTPEIPAARYFGIWLLLAILATIPFWFTDWDMRIASSAMSPSPASSGVVEWSDNAPLWQFFYRAAPALVGLLAFMGLGMAVAGLLRDKWSRLRPMGLYLLLTVILGPGVLVNAISKEYAGRPRPRQVEQLAGELKYLPPFMFGKVGEGKSFPCGHCSVGFSFAALWLLVRRRNLWLGRLALAGGLTLGMLMGGGRIAAGAHFFSDVLWSGLMTMLAAGVTYYYIVRLPECWAAWQAGESAGESTVPRRRGVQAAAFAGVAVLLVLGLLLASPVHEDFTYQRDDAGEDPAVLNLDVGAAETRLNLIGPDAEAVGARASVRGFGFPWNKVHWQATLKKEENVPNIYISMKRRGFFTDYEATLDLEVSADEFKEIRLIQDGGRLTVSGSAAGLELNLEGVDPKVQQVFINQ